MLLDFREPAGGRAEEDPLGRNHVMDHVIFLDRESQLLEIEHALRPSRRLAGRLHGGEHNREQDEDQSNHHQRFNQRQAPSFQASFSGQSHSPNLP